jgi:hypothetical protein
MHLAQLCVMFVDGCMSHVMLLGAARFAVSVVQQEEWLMRLEQLRLVGQQRSGTSRSAITSAVGSAALAMPRAARPGSLLGN